LKIDIKKTTFGAVFLIGVNRAMLSLGINALFYALNT